MAGAISRLNATTIIGGGSTAEVVAELGLNDKMSFVSTGGGSSLLFLSGEALPGWDKALLKKDSAISDVEQPLGITCYGQNNG